MGTPDRVRTFGVAAVGGVLVVSGVLIWNGLRSSGEIGPPEILPRPLVLGLLFAVPAVIGALGVARRSAVLLLGAAMATLIAAPLSIATIALAIPALLFAVAAAGAGTPARRSGWLVSAAIVGLQLGAVVGLLSTSENRCWVAYAAGNGQYEYRIVPESDASPIMGGPGQPVASGCDGGALTWTGIGLATVLAVGAIAIAATASPGGSPRRGPGTADG